MNIYVLIGAAIFAVMCFGVYKFIRERSDFWRMAVWIAIAAFVLFGVADRHFNLIPPPNIEFSSAKRAAIINILGELEGGLRAFQEVDNVEFLPDETFNTLTIKLVVNNTADERFRRFIKDEALRMWLRALANNWNNPEELFGSGKYARFFSGIKIAVEITAAP